MAKNIESFETKESASEVSKAPEAMSDQSAMMAILAEQVRQLIAENKKLQDKESARHIPRGESLEEKIRLQRTIRMRTWGKDRLGNPKCLTGGEAAQMHVEFGLGRLTVISPNECCKIYGLELDDDGSLLHLGKKIKGTSDDDFIKEQSGGKTLAQRTAELAKRSQVLLNRFGIKVAMPDSNDLDAWENAIADAEMQARSSTGSDPNQLPDFSTAPSL